MKKLDDSNKKEGILFSNNKKGEVVLVSFGGIRQGLGIPFFEFNKILNPFECDKIFVRDFSQMWYQNGVDSDIQDLSRLLEKLKAITSGYKKVVFIGNSMGGYAAILFGLLIDIDHVISFAPQTFIDKRNRFMYWDRRWKKQMKKIHKAKLYPQYYDLQKVFRMQKHSSIKIDVYYSSLDRLDKIHSERIGTNSEVILHKYDSGGHNLVKDLKSSGELDKILKDSILM